MYWSNTDDRITDSFFIANPRIRDIKSNNDNRIIKLWTNDVPLSVKYCVNTDNYRMTDSFFTVNHRIREIKLNECQVVLSFRCKWIDV